MALSLLERLMLADAKVTVILEWAPDPPASRRSAYDEPRRPEPARHTLALGHRPDSERRRQLRLSPGAKPDGPAPRPARRFSGYYAIEVPLPDRAARQAFIEWYLETQPSSLSERAWSPTRIALAVAGKVACTAGLADRRAYSVWLTHPKAAIWGYFRARSLL